MLEQDDHVPLACFRRKKAGSCNAARGIINKADQAGWRIVEAEPIMGTAINLNQLAESASAATKGMFPSSFLLFLVIGERLLDQLSCRLLRDADILVGSQLLGEQLSTMIPIFFADQFDNVIPELFRIDCKYKGTSISGLAKKLLSYCEFVNDYLESCWNNDKFKLLIDPNEDLYAFITQNYPLPISYQNIVMEKLESPKKENHTDAKKISLETIQLMLTAASTTYFPDTKISCHFSNLLTLPYQTNRYEPKREDILSYKRDCAFLYMALTDCLDINGYQPQIRGLARKIGEFRNTPEKLEENQKAAENVFSLVTEILICYLPLYMKTAKGMKIAEQFKQLMFKNNPDFTSPQSFLKEFLNLSNPHEPKSVIFTETVATSLLTKTDHKLNDKMLKEKVENFSFTIYAFSQSISCSLQNLWLTAQDLTEKELGNTPEIEERLTKLLDL